MLQRSEVNRQVSGDEEEVKKKTSSEPEEEVFRLKSMSLCCCLCSYFEVFQSVFISCQIKAT